MPPDTKSNPKAAIIIPTYNRADLIANAIASCQAQSEKDIEVIVVDDCSSDDTEDVVLSIGRIDTRVRYYRQSSKLGAPAARNRGFSESIAEFVMFLDSDDVLHHDKIRRQLELFHADAKEHDAVVCQTALFESDPTDARRAANRLGAADELLERLLKYDIPLHTSAPLWRRETFARIGGFREDLVSQQDYELHVRATLDGVRFFLADEVLSFYRLHHGARISSDRPVKEMKSRGACFRIICDLLRKHELWDRSHRRVQALNMFWTAIRSEVLTAGNQARSQLREAIEIEPSVAQRLHMLAVFALVSQMLRVRRSDSAALRVCRAFGIDLYDREFWMAHVPLPTSSQAGRAS